MSPDASIFAGQNPATRMEPFQDGLLPDSDRKGASSLRAFRIKKAAGSCFDLLVCWLLLFRLGIEGLLQLDFVTFDVVKTMQKFIYL